jgi:CBS domain containing-hemolysin-like protein
MTLWVALGVLAGAYVLLLVLMAPHAPRLLRHGVAPPRPRRYWLTLVVGREIGTAVAAAAAAMLVLAAGTALPVWAAAAVAGGVAYLVVEAVGPACGLLLPDPIAERMETRVHQVLAPVRRPFERPAVLLAGLIAGRGGLARASVLQFAADGAVDEDEEAELGRRARELLAHVRALRQRPVRAVMTPRMQTVSLPLDLGGPALLAAVLEQRFSRVPIHHGDRDDVIGILYAKDLLGRDVGAPDFRVEPLLRPAVFVPVGMRAGDVFRELRRRKVHLALVVDEYGGLAGLVTMEDLLEELFGEIRDEFDEAESSS